MLNFELKVLMNHVGYLALLLFPIHAMAQVGVEQEAKEYEKRQSVLQPTQAHSPKSASEVVTSKTSSDWKGPLSEYDFSISAMTGLGLLSDSAGLPVIGALSRKILHEGFVPDVSDQVHLEGALGPMFIKGATVWSWSAHLRWDFKKDELWTPFAIGGVGGHFVPDRLGKREEFFPKFGVGAFYSLGENFKLRTELSHTWISAGVALFF
jgi:hypothetical protein